MASQMARQAWEILAKGVNYGPALISQSWCSGKDASAARGWGKKEVEEPWPKVNVAR